MNLPLTREEAILVQQALYEYNNLLRSYIAQEDDEGLRLDSEQEKSILEDVADRLNTLYLKAWESNAFHDV